MQINLAIKNFLYIGGTKAKQWEKYIRAFGEYAKTLGHEVSYSDFGQERSDEFYKIWDTWLDAGNKIETFK